MFRKLVYHWKRRKAIQKVIERNNKRSTTMLMYHKNDTAYILKNCPKISRITKWSLNRWK